MVTVLRETSVQRKEASLHDGLEDGTLPFHNIVALGCALDIHQKLYGCMEVISRHTLFLANRMYKGLAGLKHANGRALCELYYDSEESEPYTNSKLRGATIAFNVVDSRGQLVGHTTVERLANERNISLRSGGLCNPGGIATYLKVEPWQFKRAISAGFHCGSGDEEFQVINGIRTGVVRASLGAMSTISDVDLLITFLKDAFMGNVEITVIPAVLNTPLIAKEVVGQVEDRLSSLGFKDACSVGLNLPKSISTAHSMETMSATDVSGSTLSQGREIEILDTTIRSSETVFDKKMDKVLAITKKHQRRLKLILWVKNRIHKH